MSAYVLVAEDDEKQEELIRRYLVHDGPTARQPDSPTALKETIQRPPDLLVLDWILPSLDGMEICRRIRATGDMPILILLPVSPPDADTPRGALWGCCLL
ncbi:response regulator [Streptomyces phaeochromogenes]